jgi:phenylacetate-coenzyme A ligase PaaK-like adenylate-forming protein
VYGQAGGDVTRSLSGQLIARTSWTADQLAAHQRDRLNELLRQAVANSPYYRRVLGKDAARGEVPLRELPTLTKPALMEHFDEIVTDDRLRHGTVQAHLAGSAAGEPLDGYRVFSTAGSTGLRGVFIYSAAEFAVWVAAQMRMLHIMGVTPAMRKAAIGAPGPVHLSRQVFAALAAGPAAGQAAPASGLSVTTPVPQMVAGLNACQPDAIATYASTAAMLAEEQLAGRLHIAPAIVAAGAEVLTADMRQRITAAWGLEPHQAYLATEAPLLASTCTRQVGMHLWEDLTLAEIVDDHDQPVEPGVRGHKVLITNLVNHTQPLIRYELSDSVTVAAGVNPAGMPFRRLTAVDGRSDDAVTLPAADGTTVTVHPVRLRAPLRAFPDVVQYQIVYDGQVLTVRLVLRAGSSADQPGQIRSALTRAIEEAGAAPPPITAVPVPAIEREPGPAGKCKLIKIVHPAVGG